MKKIALIFSILLMCFATFAETRTMYVNVKSAALKQGTGFFSRKLATLSYGQSVSVIGEKGKWSQVQVAGKSGFVSSSSLTKRKIASNSKFSASTDELALAGKGFNAEVESEYKKSGNVNYAAVDQMEKTEVSDDVLLDFINSGKLNGGE